MSGNPPFFSQYSALPDSSQRMDNSRFQYAAGGTTSQAGSSFNMNTMASALPDYGSQSQAIPSTRPQSSGQPRPSSTSTPAMVYQMQQNLQYPHQAGANYGSQGGHGGFGHGQYTGYGQTQGAQSGAFPQLQQQRMGGMLQQYQGYSQMSPQYYYFPGATSGYTSMSYGPGNPLQSSMIGRGLPGLQGSVGGEGLDGYLGADSLYSGMRRQASNTSLNSVPRGPPRKPKQSGHALWVGNLPPGATVIDLKDHFSREATRDIESLFLISKSNCAFVNYRSEAACQSAMQRFHDSRFSGVRLVCRLRRSSTAASGAPTAPAAMGGRRPSVTSSNKSPVLESAESVVDDAQVVTEPVGHNEDAPEAKVPEKFFVVKSLTLQDLEQSVRNGIWATQSHNEQILNKAFQSADNVYLVFSANKSGEYFGYARMTSPINEDAAEIMRTLPQNEPTDSSDTPKTIPTPATEWAPRGRIIDDSARGTIFWEAELSDEDDDSAGQTLSSDAEAQPNSTQAQVWGKPFKIEWLSTNRLPFYRTRGLRNPWNANREVKIARDGTELETGVGKRLVQMFHRPGPAPSVQMPIMGGPGQLGPQLGGPGVPY